MKQTNKEEYYSVSPYNENMYKNLSYAKASPDKRYIKILKYFYDNGESDKFSAVSVNDGLLATKKEGRRTLFTITDEGKALLTSCGAI